jgi:hypothetical protein
LINALPGFDRIELKGDKGFVQSVVYLAILEIHEK